MVPELTPDLLLRAYASGIFPMAEDRNSDEIYWVDPRRRGIMPLNGFRISRSLARRLRRTDYQITINAAFPEVVTACADREETWINQTIYDLYRALHDGGFAHSLEVWINEDLAGGVYGVALGGAFFGESMFSRRRDASKIALAYLVDRLNETGFRLFDTQFVTDHLLSLGALEISRAEYRAKLADALESDCSFDAEIAIPTPQLLLQRNTQTS